VKSWNPTFDEIGNLIDFSQGLSQDLNIKQSEQEFLATIFLLIYLVEYVIAEIKKTII